MTDTLSQTEMLKLATRRAQAKIGFLIHAAIFLAVNAAMAIMAQRTGGFTPSFLWCAAAWTAALLIQGIGVFVEWPDIRQRAIAAELRRIRASAGRQA